MGFAAGMYAGQKAAESAIDNFRSSRRNRDERQVQAEIEGLQTKNAEEIESSTAAGGAYDVEQLRLASMSPQQLKAQQVGLGTTPAGSIPQMSPVDNPQFRPDPNQTFAQGLMRQPRNSELLSAYPVAPNSQQSRSPASGQAMGMGARPEQVAAVTQSEMLRKREGLLRSRGQTDMADDVAIRASNQEDIEYRQGRDVKEDERNAVIDEQTAQKFQQELEINGFTIENGQRTQQLRAAFEATAGMSDEEIFSSRHYQDLDAELKTAYLVQNTGLRRATIDSLAASIKGKVDGAKTVQKLLALYTAEETLTAGTYVVMEKGKDGVVELVTYSDDDDVEQERMPFASENMMERYMRTKATDPALAAQSYSTEMKAAATTMAAYKQDIFDNKMSISEAVMKGTDTLINSEVYAGLDDDEKEIMKLQIFAPLESLMTADEFTNLVGGIVIPEEGDNTLTGYLKRTLGVDPKTVSYSAQDGDPLQGSPDANKQQRLQSEITELEEKAIDQQPPLLVDQDGNLRGPTPQEAIRQRQQGLGRGGEFIRNKEERQNADSEKLKSLYAELAELEGQNSANRSQARGLTPGK
jgi:hypothetical protein